jgi:hypothetical protein
MNTYVFILLVGVIAFMLFSGKKADYGGFVKWMVVGGGPAATKKTTKSDSRQNDIVATAMPPTTSEVSAAMPLVKPFAGVEDTRSGTI